MPHSADELLSRHARLLSERVVWESHWAEVAQHVLPRSDFFQGLRNPGEEHTEKILDATACLALERFTASMESMLIPRTQRWHGLRSQRAELKDDPEVRVWLDSVCDLLFAMRYAPRRPQGEFYLPDQRRLHVHGRVWHRGHVHRKRGGRT